MHEDELPEGLQDYLDSMVPGADERLAREHFATTSEENGGPVGPIPFRSEFTDELLNELTENGGTSFLIPTGQQVVLTTGPIPSLGIWQQIYSGEGHLCAHFYMSDFRSYSKPRFVLCDILQAHYRGPYEKSIIVKLVNSLIAHFFAKRSAAPRPPEFS